MDNRQFLTIIVTGFVHKCKFTSKSSAMESSVKEKRVWQTPDLEIINSKMTKGGSHSWDVEGGNYYDNYAS